MRIEVISRYAMVREREDFAGLIQFEVVPIIDSPKGRAEEIAKEALGSSSLNRK